MGDLCAIFYVISTDSDNIMQELESVLRLFGYVDYIVKDKNILMH